MRNFISIMLLLFNASTAMAQTAAPEDAPTPATSPQRMVVEALNYPPPRPTLPEARAPVQAAPAAAGIGPSSSMQQPGDYGYSAWSDLRQLNF